MDTDGLAHQLSQMHIDHASVLTQIADVFSTGGETGVLLWLSQRKVETFAIDIAEHFGLTPGRVANILKKLEQRDYVNREQDPADFRKSRIFLTRQGAESAGQLYEKMTEGHRRLLSALGAEDARCAIHILDRVIRLMDSGIELPALDLQEL